MQVKIKHQNATKSKILQNSFWRKNYLRIYEAFAMSHAIIKMYAVIRIGETWPVPVNEPN